ncbi:major facilitator superfamily domain-containing protein [Dactylonectria macrodidyma]|uniref:Major facilitator superfamily domain-containing protein n=1 Tax=Dactylonectria macrodidyma TaxID=307937 RepID=A0A9P9F321_9HYPO|nr:major facilitator superfamily domain-containing protein [Dactylonectria macrodidyma]
MATTTQLEPGIVSETYELESRTLNPLPKNDEQPEPQSNPTDSKMSRATYLKIVSAGFSFFVAGVNDGSIGALVPYVIRDYGITTAIVSSVYGANFMGWLLAALTNTHLSQKFDLGAMLMLGAVLQVAAHALRTWKPPFGLYAVTFWLASLGQAYQDTHGNTFVAGVKGAHRWLAFIHAMYMAGCLCGPFVATGVASAGEVSHWYLFYCFPLAIGLVNVALVFWAFRDSVGYISKQSSNGFTTAVDAETAANPDNVPLANAAEDDSASALIRDTLKTRSVWLLSLFFFCFLGATLTAGGWVVEYLVVVRDGDLSKMGYVPAGFNGGSLLGRLLLAEPTHRFGARTMIFLFSIASICLQLLFWLVPNIVAASISISLLGFFMGPYFATGISVGSKLFSPRIHSTALAFVFVFAQLGGCFFPIVTGLIAARAGVSVLQPILCGLLTATSISWLFVPKPKESENTALHRE